MAEFYNFISMFCPPPPSPISGHAPRWTFSTGPEVRVRAASPLYRGSCLIWYQILWWLVIVKANLTIHQSFCRKLGLIDWIPNSYISGPKFELHCTMSIFLGPSWPPKLDPWPTHVPNTRQKDSEDVLLITLFR